MTLLNLTLHLQIIVPTYLLVFGFFVGTLLSYLDPPSPHAYQFSRFCFADIPEIVKTNCSIFETVSSLVQTVLISYQF